MNKTRKYFDPKTAAKLSNLPLTARLAVEGYLIGQHKSPYHGFSVEFSEHKAYGIGDEIKHIDWKIFGKTDRYYVKRFEEETNLRSYILLDTSKSMGFGNGSIDKITYGAFLSTALSYLMLKQRDSVGLVLFNDKITRFLPGKSSKSHLNIIMNTLGKIELGNNTKIKPILDQMAQRIKKRGLVILISDLLDDPDEIMKGLSHFKHNKQEVIVFHILDKKEFDFDFKKRTKFIDMETGKTITTDPWHIRESYKERFDLYQKKYKLGCRKQKIDYVPLFTNHPLDFALSEYLKKRKKTY